jgi:hypothetical protein
MVTNGMESRTREEVARMMLDPSQAAAGIRAALQAQRPLTDAEKAFLVLSRSAGAGTAAALTSQ